MMERKTIKTSKNILTHWSRTPYNLTPACGTKGDDWMLTPAGTFEINGEVVSRIEEGKAAVSCYKCQRKHGRSRY